MLEINVAMNTFFKNLTHKITRQWWIVIGCVAAVLLGVLIWLLVRPKRVEPFYPVVVAQTVLTDDVELYGEYVGRIYVSLNNNPQYVVRSRTDGEKPNGKN